MAPPFNIGFGTIPKRLPMWSEVFQPRGSQVAFAAKISPTCGARVDMSHGGAVHCATNEVFRGVKIRMGKKAEFW